MLFDNEAMDLVLDFTSGDGKPWRRLTSSQAKSRKAKKGRSGSRLGLDAEELDELLESGETEEEGPP